MNPAAKLAAYSLVLGIALGGGAAVGKAVGPIDPANDEMNEHEQHGPTVASSHQDATQPDTEEAMPTGVLISQDGYTLEADAVTLDGAPRTPFTFHISGPDGTPLREFVDRHERELHLILVGSDLGTYTHLHPSRSEDGKWSAELPALAPGVYRAFADFAVVGGPELTLGVDVTVAGEAVYAPLPPISATTDVAGYTVRMTGTPAANAETELTVSVSRGGQPVTDLDPYLGAFGHLVAIRSGDLAYLHVHPLGGEVHAGASGGPDVRFAVHVPSTGDYRLFFDFSHDGEVHTAAFTVQVTDSNGDG